MEYPQHNIYDSLENARKNGWLSTWEARRYLAKTAYKIVDTSGSNECGYRYAVHRPYNEELDGEHTLENCRGKFLIGSELISFNHFDKGSNTDGYKMGSMFNNKKLEQLINKGEQK